MKESDRVGCAFIVCTLIAGCVGLFIGENCASARLADQIRAEAIRAHVAEYYLDQNNERKFRWKECK